MSLFSGMIFVIFKSFIFAGAASAIWIFLWLLANSIRSAMWYSEYCKTPAQPATLAKKFHDWYRNCLFLPLYLPFSSTLHFFLCRMRRRKKIDSPSRFRFMQNEFLKLAAFRELEDKDFVSRLRVLHYWICWLRGEIVPHHGGMPEKILSQMLSRSDVKVGFLLPLPPLQFHGFAGFATLPSGDVSILAIEPPLVNSVNTPQLGGWRVREAIQHELCHFLQDHHAEIFEKERKGSVRRDLGWLGAAKIEPEALVFGSPRIAALIGIPALFVILTTVSILLLVLVGFEISMIFF